MNILKMFLNFDMESINDYDINGLYLSMNNINTIDLIDDENTNICCNISLKFNDGFWSLQMDCSIFDNNGGGNIVLAVIKTDYMIHPQDVLDSIIFLLKYVPTHYNLLCFNISEEYAYKTVLLKAIRDNAYINNYLFSIVYHIENN